jgi:hypothetical protein
MSPEQAQQAELNGQLAPIGSNPATAVGFTGTPTVATSPVAAEPTVSFPTTSLTVQGPSNATPGAVTSQQTGIPSYTGIDAIDNQIHSLTINPAKTAINLGVGFVPGVGIVNSLSGLLGGPTVGSLLTGLPLTDKGAAASGTSGDSSADTSGGSGESEPAPPTSAAIPTTTGTAGLTTAPAAATVTPVSAQEAALRKYLGTGTNLYRYGMGPERKYYSADGGYFDADRYFADGGMVQPLSPPTTPLVSAQPTMAFTDGAGSVGSIAQPPGLSQLDSFGSDAPHASPMAPSVAAAVPTMQPGLATLATPNVNAGPSPSPIAQNPNVGYALGNSPLSNLAGS